jgi:hypothetical protein
MEDAVIPDDFTGEYCCYSVKWPKSFQWLAVLRGVLTIPFDGRFWNGNTGSILGAKAQIEPTLTYNLQNNEVIMACGDEALNDIALAIRYLADKQAQTANSNGSGAACCGNGSAGGGEFPADPSTNEEGNPDEDPPPEGYDTWEQFFTQKCGVAWDIIDKLKDSLGQLAVVAFGSLSVGTLIEIIAVILTLTISSAGIAAIAALLLSVSAVIIVTSALNIVNENEHDLMCALYEGNNAAESRSLFLARFNALVDEASIDVIEGFVMKQLIAYMVETTETNRMYVQDNSLDWASVTADRNCDGCTELCWLFDEDLEDWDTGHDIGVAGDCDTMPALGTLGWEDGAMRGTSTSSGGASYVTFLSPEFEHVIQEGEQLCTSLCGMSHPGQTYTDRAQIILDGVCVQLPGSTGIQNTGDFAFDLSPYVGQTLSRIWFCWIKAGTGEFWMDICETGINCPACED